MHRHFRRRGELLEAVLRDRVQLLRDRAEGLLTAPSTEAPLMAWLRDVVAHAAVP